MKIQLVVFHINKEELEVIKGIQDQILGRCSGHTVDIYDIATYGELETQDICLIFGDTAKLQVKSPNIFIASSPNLLKDNKEHRKKTWYTVLELCNFVNTYSAQSGLEKVEIEVEDMVIGRAISKSEIEISSEALEYLLKLKELLAGKDAKIIITKGDKKIEIENDKKTNQ